MRRYNTIIALVLTLLMIHLPLVEALSISNLQVTPTSNTSTVSWDTDVASNAIIKHGIDSLTHQITNPAFTLHHVMSIPSLVPLTQYQFYIESASANGSRANSSGTFTTTHTPAPAQVTGVTLDGTTLSSITIHWDASGETDLSLYRIFRNNVYLTNVSSATRTFTDTGLASGATLFYQISAFDNDFNEGAKSTPLFATTAVPDTTSPIITNVSVQKTSGLAITWNTDEASSSFVDFGTTSALGITAGTNATSLTHSVTLTNLTTNQQYSYRVRSCDAAGNCAQSQLATFKAGLDIIPPTLEVVAPASTNKGAVEISGVTEAKAFVQLFVGSAVRGTVAQVPADGKFLFRNVALTTGNNAVRIISRDDSGNTAEKKLTIFVDARPPNLQIVFSQNVSRSSDITINGSVDENSTLRFYVRDANSAVEPRRVEGLRFDQDQLTWTAQPSENVSFYIVYRDDVGPIARTTAPGLRDSHIAAGVQYIYRVSAMSHHCVEGIRSDPLRLSYNTTIDPNSTSTVDINCDEPAETSKDIVLTNGTAVTFSEVVPLSDGASIVTVEATDLAGNKAMQQFSVLSDNSAPRFDSLNLRSLSPSYLCQETLRGSTSEPSTILVFLGDDKTPIASVPTVLENGVNTFQIPLALRKDSSLEVQVGGSSANSLDTTAKATLSNKAWDNHVRIVARDFVGNEATEEDVIRCAMCGFGTDWQISTSSPMPNELTPQLIMQGFAQIGLTYNLTWQGLGPAPTIHQIEVDFPPLSDNGKERYDDEWVRKPILVFKSENPALGFIQVNLKRNDPVSVRDNNTDPTYYQRELNLSQNHKGDCDLPGTGCLKLPLMMTIEYGEAKAGGTGGLQKQCWDSQVFIQPPAFDPDDIPKTFLNSSVKAIDAALDVINQTLKVTKPATKYATIGCIGTMVLTWGKYFSDFFSCTGVKEDKCLCDPLTGKCDNSECESCYTARRSTKQLEDAQHYLCDRVFCPAVPTYESYALANKKNKKSNCFEYEVSSATALEDYANIKDCGTLGIPPLSQADKHCCLAEYNARWKSGILMGDEVKMSKCLSLKDAGKEDTEEYRNLCGGFTQTFSSIADFSLCGNNAGSNLQYVSGRVSDGSSKPTGSVSGLTGEQALHSKDTSLNSDKSGTDSTSTPSSKGEAAVTLGNEGLHSQSSLSTPTKPTTPTGPSVIKNYVVDVKKKRAWDISLEERGEVGATGELKNVKTYSQILTDLEQRTPDFTVENCQDSAAKARVPAGVYSLVCAGVGTTKFIANPASGLLRSIQAVCLSAITAYLRHYQQILQLIRACFQTILYTGQGSAGVCQAVLSNYICDLVYELIRCIQDPATEGAGQDYEGITGVFKALSYATANVKQSVTDRYGQSNLYNALFVQKKLIHSVCLAAFTGDWNLDWDALVQQATKIPIDSTVAIGPANRRFISFNPTTGRATHIYEVGLVIVAGADLDYRVNLVCSNSFGCQYSDKKDTSCDCVKDGKEKILDVTNRFSGNNHLLQAAVLNDAPLIEVNAKDIASSDVRYDKVRVEYRYKDNSGQQVNQTLESPITQVGGDPPASCTYREIGGFLCQIFTDADGVAFFAKQPVPVYSNAQVQGSSGFFTVGQRITLETEIAVLPGTLPEAERKKAARIEVINQNGAPVFAEKFYELTSLTSDKNRFIPEEYLVKKADFNLKLGARQPCTVLAVNGKIPLAISESFNSAGVAQAVKLVKTTEKYSICRIDIPQLGSPKPTSLNVEPVCKDAPLEVQPSESSFLYGNNLRIFLPTNTNAIPKEGSTSILVCDAAQTVTTQDDCPKTEVKWTVRFSLHSGTVGAEKDQNGWQRTPEYYQGAAQSVEVPISLKCQEGGTEALCPSDNTGALSSSCLCPDKGGFAQCNLGGRCCPATSALPGCNYTKTCDGQDTTVEVVVEGDESVTTEQHGTVGTTPQLGSLQCVENPVKGVRNGGNKAGRDADFGQIDFASDFETIVNDGVGANLVELNFMGYKYSISQNSRGIKTGGVNKKVFGAYKCVEQEILSTCDAAGKNYKITDTNTRRGSNSGDLAKSGSVSNHVYGIAIDVNPSTNPDCRDSTLNLRRKVVANCEVAPDQCTCTGKDPCPDNVRKSEKALAEAKKRLSDCAQSKPFNLPNCWIKAFQKYGFRWLGDKAYGADNNVHDWMHFDFQGDLSKVISYEVATGGVVTPGSNGVNPTSGTSQTGLSPMSSPNVVQSACTITEDSLLVTSVGSQKVFVWIPREARCGGSYPFIYLFHGITNNDGWSSMIAPQNTVDTEIGATSFRKSTLILENTARALINTGKSQPVILIAPTDPKPSSSDLFSSMNLKDLHMLSIVPFLIGQLISASSVSAISFSGSNCLGSTMPRFVDEFKGAGITPYLIGLADGTCGETSDYGGHIASKLQGTSTILLLETRGSTGSDRSSLVSVAGPSPSILPCTNTQEFTSCKKNPQFNWYVYQLNVGSHYAVPAHLLQDAMTAFFAKT